MMRVIQVFALLITSSAAQGTSFLKSVKDFGRRLQEPSTNPCEDNNGELLSIGAFYDVPFPENKCSCQFENDLEGLDIDGEALGDPTGNTNFWNDLVNVVNSLLQNLNYQYSNSCSAAKCQCIGSACGMVAAKERIAVQGSEDANLTLADVFSLLPALQEATAQEGSTNEELVDAGTSNVTALAVLFGPYLFTQNVIEFCIDYSKGEGDYSGKACLNIDSKLEGEVLTTFSSAAQDCELSYKGKQCSSCTFEGRDGKTCITADCGGVKGVNAQVDSCAGKGVDGPFQFLDDSLEVTGCTGSGAYATTSYVGVVVAVALAALVL